MHVLVVVGMNEEVPQVPRTLFLLGNNLKYSDDRETLKCLIAEVGLSHLVLPDNQFSHPQFSHLHRKVKRFSAIEMARKHLNCIWSMHLLDMFRLILFSSFSRLTNVSPIGMFSMFVFDKIKNPLTKWHEFAILLDSNKFACNWQIHNLKVGCSFPQSFVNCK